MTIRELVSSIRENLVEHNIDSVFTNRHLYRTALSVAKTLIQREVDQSRKIFNQNSGWSSYCLEMVEVSPVDCPVVIPVPCKIYRSYCKLPQFMETSYGMLFKLISTPDYSINFTLTDPQYFNIKSNIKYNKENYAFIADGYLFTPKNEYPLLKIIAYFEKPVSSCEQSAEYQCSILDSTFPCPEYLVQPVIDETLKRLSIGKQIPFDHVTDKNTVNQQ